MQQIFEEMVYDGSGQINLVEFEDKLEDERVLAFSTSLSWA